MHSEYNVLNVSNALALDALARKLYWLDPESKMLNVYHLEKQVQQASRN